VSGAPSASSASISAARSVIVDALHTVHPPRGDPHGPLAPALLALTVLTGLVDATSYLRLGHVFVANMTGNVVFLGFALAGAGGLTVASSLVAIAAFLLGTLIGGRIATSIGEHRGHVLRAASVVETALIAVALILALALAHPGSGAQRYAVMIPLALAMGVQNATALRLAVPGLSTTVLTRTLTGLAADSRLAGGTGSNPGRRILAITAMLVGAVIGGLLVRHVSIAAAPAVALAIAVVVALWIDHASRTPGRWASA
jgi:uncharacterized membrane protein YoaK (UPF0700 family)